MPQCLRLKLQPLSFDVLTIPNEARKAVTASASALKRFCLVQSQALLSLVSLQLGETPSGREAQGVAWLRRALPIYGYFLGCHLVVVALRCLPVGNGLPNFSKDMLSAPCDLCSTYIYLHMGLWVLIPSVGKSEINKVISEGYLQVGHPGQYCVSGVQVICPGRCGARAIVRATTYGALNMCQIWLSTSHILVHLILTTTL